MTEMRLAINLPDGSSQKVYVEENEKIIDLAKMLLGEKSIPGSPEGFLYKNNNQQPVAYQNTFGAAGFKNGDALYICEDNAAVQLPSTIAPIPESRTFHQLGILLLDGSESMTVKGASQKMTPAESVDQSVREFLTFFKTSSLVKNFSLAVITFDHTARIHTNVTELSQMDDYADYDPAREHGGGTYIGGALALAEQLANQFLSRPEASDLPTEVKMIVLSDGLCLAPDETRVVAERIKRNDKIMICASLFVDPKNINNEDIQAAKSVLADIVSMPSLYKTTYKETDLRAFFINSMSARRRYGA